MHFLLSRTDAIGDVVLILPIAGVLKREFPESQVSLLVRRATSLVGRYCRHVHAVLNWDEIERLPAREQVEILEHVGADVTIHIYPNRAIARRAGANRARVTQKVYELHPLAASDQSDSRCGTRYPTRFHPAVPIRSQRR